MDDKIGQLRQTALPFRHAVPIGEYFVTPIVKPLSVTLKLQTAWRDVESAAHSHGGGPQGTRIYPARTPSSPAACRLSAWAGEVDGLAVPVTPEMVMSTGRCSGDRRPASDLFLGRASCCHRPRAACADDGAKPSADQGYTEV